MLQGRKVTSSLTLEAESLAKLFMANRPKKTNLGNLKVDNNPVLPMGRKTPYIRITLADDSVVYINVSANVSDEFNGEVKLQDILHGFPVQKAMSWTQKTDKDGNPMYVPGTRKPILARDEKGNQIPYLVDGVQGFRYLITKPGASDTDVAFDIAAVSAKPVATGAEGAK